MGAQHEQLQAEVATQAAALSAAKRHSRTAEARAAELASEAEVCVCTAEVRHDLLQWHQQL